MSNLDEFYMVGIPLSLPALAAAPKILSLHHAGPLSAPASRPRSHRLPTPQVRVAGLTQLARGGVGTKSVDGLTPAQQLTRINSACKTLLHDQQALWRQMRQELPVQAGIDIIRNTKEELDEADRLHLKQFFDNELWPQLTPQSVDPAHPFPFIANRGMGLMFTLQRSASNAKNAARKLMQQGRWQVPAGTDDDKAAPPPDMQAIVLIPPSLPRFVRLPDRGQASTGAQGNGRGQGAQRASAAQVRPEQGEVGLSRLRFILIEDVISEYMGAFFPDYVVREKGMFRILRDSEVEVDDEAVDLVRMFETALKRRRKGVVILLAVDATMPAELRQFLTDRLRVEPSQVVVIDGLVGLADIKQLITDDRRSLQFPPFKPRFPERIGQFGGDLFAAIRAKDLVVHHPFETFDVVLQFLRQAARDPDVISIKQTLYRTSHDSPIVKELIEAAESGKTVTALIELKARFDEEANIRWAKDMERAGVQVVYGFVELKTHAKVALVMRREKDGLRPYVHFGTGNYHPYTAKIYTDLSLFTADAALCRDANRLFNFMTSLRKPYDLEEIAVAPVNLRTAIETHIRMEIANAKEGHPAAIWAKMNALVDSSMINLLYQASEVRSCSVCSFVHWPSARVRCPFGLCPFLRTTTLCLSLPLQAGVNITLVVRGICALRPGVPGLSSRIVVKSIVGRFLEHSRVVAFANKHALPSPHANVYISSADWMTRNLGAYPHTLTSRLKRSLH